MHTIRLASGELRDHRHVCALVDGPDDAYAFLMPFIADGFEQGDRAFHIVDPQARDGHLERLRASGIDVSAATATRQLEVLTWDEAYLRDGRFDRSAQLTLIREILAEGPSLGYPVTRAIGSMDWAIDTEMLADLTLYEARVDELLRRLPDVFVCTYDLGRHNARTIAAVLGLHAVAVVDGVLRTGPEPSRESARDRLLTAAAQLFHENGIQATGVDSLIAAAGVAKATFYRHFPSKDDLVVAWLRDPRTRWFDRVRGQAEASAADPHDQILLFFEAAAEWLETEGFRGCPYLNTGVEITDPSHPARVVVRDFLDDIQAYFRRALSDARYVDAELLAPQLHALLAGAISLAVARRTGAFALAARDAAGRLLATAARSPSESG